MSKDVYVEADGLHWRVGTNGVPLESPDGRDWVVWRSTASDLFRAATPSPALLHEEHHLNQQVRTGAQYKNRINRYTNFHMGSTGRSHWCESGLEAACLVDLDFRGDVVALASQPFRFLFNDEPGALRHDVDFFALMADGEQRVINVKPQAEMGRAEVREQFREVDRICELIGWSHVVMHGPDRDRLRNLSLLRGARHRHFHPSQPLLATILRAFANGRRIDQGRRVINPRFPSLAMPHIHHLLWHRLLEADLSEPLDFPTIVTSAAEPNGPRSCCA